MINTSQKNYKNIANHALILLIGVIGGLIIAFFLDYLFQLWSYDLQTKAPLTEADKLYTLGKKFQRTGIVSFLLILSLLGVDGFLRYKNKNDDQLTSLSLIWSFIIIGLLIGFTFFSLKVLGWSVVENFIGELHYQPILLE